jgi:hypothetical protein
MEECKGCGRTVLRFPPYNATLPPLCPKCRVEWEESSTPVVCNPERLFAVGNRGEMMIKLRDEVREGRRGVLNHRKWSLTDAETFEEMARMIREGYNHDDR